MQDATIELETDLNTFLVIFLSSSRRVVEAALPRCRTVLHFSM